MRYSQSQHISGNSHYLEQAQPYKKSDTRLQHGTDQTLNLVNIPSETLTGITSYLDPPSLLSLARVNTALYHHVVGDNTWRRAFASRYLGIGPESDLYDNARCLLLRRSERTWRNEFIARFKLEKKWENSRSPSISHIPVPSAISHIHLMSCQVVLSSCLKYGIVARSLPLNGKVYSGYLSAAANGLGLGGIGNPNVEFAPNASTYAVTSRGSSASLLWGFLDGSVAVVLADKVMNPRRITATLNRCRVAEEHEGAVSDSAWDLDGLRAVTGGADGRVKLWVSDPLGCVWASEIQARGLVPDPCVKVAIAMCHHPSGFIVAAFRSGNISLWTNFKFTETHDIAAAVKEIHIPCPLQEFKRADNQTNTTLPNVTSLHIDATADGITLLVAYKDYPCFYRITVGNYADHSIEVTAFGDTSFGPISCLSPFFSPQPGLGSFVIAGDYLGCVSIYDWRSTWDSEDPVKPLRKLEVHEDSAAVTAIAWNGVTLMTGSARGSIHVLDGLSFTRLRSFASHSSRRQRHRLHDGDDGDELSNEAIKQIIIDASQEMFVACAGDRVLAWKAESLPLISHGKHRTRSNAHHDARRNKSGTAKYLEQLEMKETIKESRRIVEQENASYKRAFSREKEHRAGLEKLGLSEAEAVEYVMMLSREEAIGGRAHDEGQGIVDEAPTATDGVFDIDESFETGTVTYGGTTSSSYLSSSSTSISTASDYTRSSDSLSYGSPPSHREKGYYRAVDHTQHVSTPAMQAPLSTLSTSASSSSVSSYSAHFPPTTTGANKNCSPSRSTGGVGGSPESTGPAQEPNRTSSRFRQDSPRQGPATTTLAGSASDHETATISGGSNAKPKKSWSTIAKPSTPTPATTPPERPATRRFRPVGVGGTRYASNLHVGNDADLDEDLRYALELSLAEAQSRGEV